MATLKAIPTIIARAVRTGVNVHLSGEPGMGKTQSIEQTVAEIQKDDPAFQLWCIYTPSLTPTDFVMAMPDQESETLKNFRSDRLPNAYETPDARGILFLGERDNGDPATNKALQKYINNEDMGGLLKPKGVIVVSDSNEVSHRSGTVQQSLALLSRSRNIHVDLDPKETLEYFKQISLNVYVQAYLSLKPEHVSTFDKLIADRAYRVWSNPRAWERLGRSMDDADTHGEKLSDDEIIGDIGENVGREFIAFLYAACTLVSYDDIVTSPKAATQPDKLSDVYAVMAMLATMVKSTHLKAVREYVSRWGIEVQILFLRLLVSSKNKDKAACVRTEAYTSWYAEPGIAEGVCGV
jgi:hypothetical protein